MWNIKLEDLQCAKGQLQARRAKIEAKYIEETKTLDADLAEIDTLERVASAFAAKHQNADEAKAPPVPEAEDGVAVEAPEPPAAADASSGTGGKGASRWRLHLDTRAAPETEVSR